MTLIQLQRLALFISKMAGRCYETFGERAGSQLEFNTFNLYHANHWIIKPATKGYHQNKGCSLVEVMAEEVQPPRWFVSHAWIEPWFGGRSFMTRYRAVLWLDIASRRIFLSNNSQRLKMMMMTMTMMMMMMMIMIMIMMMMEEKRVPLFDSCRVLFGT